MAGGLLGLALVLLPGKGSGAPPRALLLNGRELPSTDTADTAVAWTEQRLTGWFDLALPSGELHRVTLPELGVELERERLRQMIRAAQRPSRAAPASPGALDLALPLRIDRERAVSTLLAIKEKADRAPIDAHLDVDQMAVTPERPGRALDVDRSLLALEQALERGASETRLVFTPLPPLRRASDLEGVRYDVVLGAYQTAYDTAARAEDRAINLRLIASKLDGHVVLPGAELSFNAVVGPHEESNGFRVAEVSAPEQSAAGGLDGRCQLAGTLHAAGLFAGLEIIERHPLARPGSELDVGLEAVVAHPRLDLRLGNPHDFAVVVHASVVDGRARVEVRGARRASTVTLLLVVERATPFERLEQSDVGSPSGARTLAQRGVPGLELHRYRIKRDGAHARREVDVHYYPPTPEIVLVGAGPHTAAGRPPWEAAPEPRVDELVVLSQSFQRDRPTVEQRIAGRFGPGWAKKIGEPAPGQHALASPSTPREPL